METSLGKQNNRGKEVRELTAKGASSQIPSSRKSSQILRGEVRSPSSDLLPAPVCHLSLLPWETAILSLVCCVPRQGAT